MRKPRQSLGTSAWWRGDSAGELARPGRVGRMPPEGGALGDATVRSLVKRAGGNHGSVRWQISG
jgi:hypothetical protein